MRLSEIYINEFFLKEFWKNVSEDLVNEVDFISIHTYPVWEYKNIHEANAAKLVNPVQKQTRNSRLKSIIVNV